MNDLLKLAVDAHGGLVRWNQVRAITVAASITGAIWFVKSQGDYLKDVVMTVDTKRQRLVTDFPGQNRRFTFEPEQIVKSTQDGTVLETRTHPERAFEGHVRDTPWDEFHVMYFQGEALWTYLNTPFLYTQPGFEVREIEPIKAGAETWRRLQVTFPAHIKSHTRTQISCFGPDGLLRRHDYTVDVLGGAPGLNYASAYRNVGGIIFPTQRRVYAYEGDYQPVMDPLLVGIDMTAITIE